MNQDMGISPAVSRVIKSTHQAANQQDLTKGGVCFVMVQIVVLVGFPFFFGGFALRLFGVC